MHRVVARSTDDKVGAKGSDDTVVSSVAEEVVAAVVRPDGVVPIASADGHSIADVLEALARHVDDVISGSRPDLVDLCDACLLFVDAPRQCGIDVIHKERVSIGVVGEQKHIGVG